MFELPASQTWATRFLSPTAKALGFASAGSSTVVSNQPKASEYIQSKLGCVEAHSKVSVLGQPIDPNTVQSLRAAETKMCLNTRHGNPEDGTPTFFEKIVKRTFSLRNLFFDWQLQFLGKSLRYGTKCHNIKMEILLCHEYLAEVAILLLTLVVEFVCHFFLPNFRLLLISP